MQRPVRVALLATSTMFGGIERVLLNMLQHVEAGVELMPIIFTRTDTSELSFFDRMRAMGVAHDTLYVNNVRPVYVANPIVNLVQARRILRRRRVDLIHSHGYRADVFAVPLAKSLGLPIVSTCHGFIGNDRRLRFYNALDALVLRAFTRVIAVSGQMKQDLVAHGLDPRRVDVVTNAVAAVSPDERDASRRALRARLGIAPGEFVFGYLGRLSQEKGPEFLLESAGTLVAEGRPARVLMVGDGPQKNELEAQTRSRGLGSHVDFPGFQSDTAPWYSAMDAFVLPSLTEGTPMALLEAMAHGLPVVASAVGGVPAVVTDRDNGLLVPSADPAALAAAMRTVMTDAALRGHLSARAVQAVSAAYDIRTWARSVRDVYTRTLEPAA